TGVKRPAGTDAPDTADKSRRRVRRKRSEMTPVPPGTEQYRKRRSEAKLRLEAALHQFTRLFGGEAVLYQPCEATIPGRRSIWTFRSAFSVVQRPSRSEGTAERGAHVVDEQVSCWWRRPCTTVSARHASADSP